jgi:serine/threonine protein kinase
MSWHAEAHRPGSTTAIADTTPSATLSWRAREDTVTSVALYQIVEKIAESNMALIYKAQHSLTGELAAIKVMAPELAANSVFLKRFEQEYRIARSLDHPNIVRSLDFGHYEAGPFLVMEYIEGECLADRLSRDGPLSEAEGIAIMRQIAAALDYAHSQGVIHRDVKPDNILLTAAGTAKLADLGMVKHVLHDLDLTRPGDGLGTPTFMAPEQFGDAKTVDGRADVYALGATLYTMLTGTLPFAARSTIQIIKKKALNEFTPPIELVPTLSERVDRAIRRAMSLDRNQRQSSCEEFVCELMGVEALRHAPTQPTLHLEQTPVGNAGETSAQTDDQQAARDSEADDYKWWHVLIAVAVTLGTALLVTFLLNQFLP